MFEKQLKKIRMLDLSIIKLSTFVLALWLVSLIPQFAAWVQSVNHWWFLAVSVILALIVVKRLFVD